MKKYEFDCPECSHVIAITSKSLEANPKISCPKCKGTINFDVKELKVRAVGQTEDDSP